LVELPVVLVGKGIEKRMLKWLSRDGEDCPDDVFKKMGQNGKFPS
jgi:hypothetical protein